MGLSTEELQRELEATAQEVLGRLRSRQLFQSAWDTAAFVVFLTLIGAGKPAEPPAVPVCLGHCGLCRLPHLHR
ncbi:small integral membrane protein 22 [Tupaia chinensis]|uniref:small integral membrane protein 22 n=1 Tax=Tupaia chinensis TaxID=246437 RepID=UPI0003C8F63E|nr:small integral membrane protein 22 [Tupaia chinensis]